MRRQSSSIGRPTDPFAVLRARRGYAIVVICCLLVSNARIATAASTWNPVVLVNTESFQTIDSGDALTDVELHFGQSSGEKLSWDVTQSRFEFTDELHADGNVTTSGGLAVELNIRAKANATINSDNEAADATFTFGNSVLAQTLQFVHSSQKFRFSASLDVAGTVSGSALTVSSLRNCDTIDTNASGVLSCGTDGGGGGGLSQTDGDARYVNTSGDTMTGSLSVHGTISGSILRASNMTVSGAVVYSSGSRLMQNAKGASGQLLISQGTSAPKWATAAGGMVWYFDGSLVAATSKGPQITMPFAITLSGVTLRVKGAPTGAAIIVDINQNGSSIYSTRPQIAAGALTGGTGAVLSTTTLTTNSLVTLDIDQVGSTFSGSGLTVMLRGTRKY